MKLSDQKRKTTLDQRKHNVISATAARARYEREITYDQVIAIALSRTIAKQETVIGIPIN